MDEENKEIAPIDEVKKEYVINISGGNKNRVIKLSDGLFKFGVMTFFLGVAIFIGACGYSIYSALNFQRNAAIVKEVQQAEELQQQQLLTISKKAETLTEAVQNLTQQEQELRIQAGLKPPKEAEPEPVWTPPTDENVAPADATQPAETEEPTWTPPTDSDYTGQGGPIGNLTVENVSEALALLESSVNLRKESLDDFQAELKAQREQIAVAAATSVDATTWAADVPYTSDSTVTTWTPSTVASYDIRQFGGNPAADSHMPSIWPTTGVVTSPYGLRWGGSDFHPGMDIANDMGTPIVATADGVVDYAGWNAGGYGNMVDIDHGNGIMTRYGHASQVVVSAGQYVKRGQLIAYMGSTGFSTGPHVHYEVHVNGQRVNPISYL